MDEHIESTSAADTNSTRERAERSSCTCGEHFAFGWEWRTSETHSAMRTRWACGGSTRAPGRLASVLLPSLRRRTAVETLSARIGVLCSVASLSSCACKGCGVRAVSPRTVAATAS